jgi:hypothetical protein
MLETKRREVIALLGGGGLLLAVKVRRAPGKRRQWRDATREASRRRLLTRPRPTPLLTPRL